MKRGQGDRIVWSLIGLAAGAAAGTVVLAGLDSAWALLWAVGFLVAVILLAIYGGITATPSPRGGPPRRPDAPLGPALT